MSALASGLKRLSRGPDAKQNSLLLPALGLIAVAFLYPVIAMLVRSFTTSPGGLHFYQQVFTTGGILTILGRSLMTAAIVTAIALLIGYPYAYVAATARRRVGLALVGIAASSLFISVIVRSYAWLAILEPHGVLDDWLGHVGIHVDLAHNLPGVVIGMTQYAVPFMVLSLYDTMRRLDVRLMRAAATLGASPRRAFLRIYLPLTLPGLVAGCVIVFITVLGYYIIPAILGGPTNTMIGQLIATEIQTTLNWGLGSAEGALVLLVTLIAFTIFYRASMSSRGARGNA